MAAEEAGEVIVQFADKQHENSKPVFRIHTTRCSQSTKTPAGVNTAALPELPASGFQCKGFVRILFKADAADIIESEESSMQLPLLIYNLATNQLEGSQVITLNTATGFTTAGTVDVTCVAGIPVYVAHWEVPDGKYVRLAAGQKFHCYMGDDT